MRTHAASGGIGLVPKIDLAYVAVLAVEIECSRRAARFNKISNLKFLLLAVSVGD